MVSKTINALIIMTLLAMKKELVLMHILSVTNITFRNDFIFLWRSNYLDHQVPSKTIEAFWSDSTAVELKVPVQPQHRQIQSPTHMK
jgi:hypothetical protein